jgi:pimeloyl-ACP methyl ester carboxylesterase
VNLVSELDERVARSQRISSAAAQVYAKRVELAAKRYQASVAKAQQAAKANALASPMDLWRDWSAYAVDAGQRSVLYWDTLRQRGNQWLANERAGKPPVLHFDHEMVLDARAFDRPANYALLRIVPPKGVKVDPKRRPYVIIDPRAGHGPGIGGFKDDSQVGVALAAGHPVYFVMFFPDPVPGQTLLDVTAAEREFIAEVRIRHPDAKKPAIVGNCQGGWAAMMLAASDPEATGPLVINGAPMSYWGGAWNEGEGDNPMRYAGGMLGGTWLASLTADLSGGVFDGAYLVQNFENLNPANTFFGKSYHLYANVDTEPPRYLDFERWWGGFYLMNREEIEWITHNLFVGNKLWKGGVSSGAGKVFDLREIKSPIVLFASLGDNITPPEQAFNWVADVYGSTDEIKARGQTIVGLMHANIGHLGIFVSGGVARREHRQIVSVLESIEALPPGLYGMKITDREGEDGAPAYDVEFVERRLEDVIPRLNRFERVDEQPFEVVAKVSDFNQRAYELFAQPAVQAIGSEAAGKALRAMHPLRAERWAVSDLNPWLWWLGPAATAVKEQRQPASCDQPFARAEKLGAALTSAAWDYYRDLRDAASEAAFFQLYGSLFGLGLADAGAKAAAVSRAAQQRDAALVRGVLARIGEGGYAAALARTAHLLADRGRPLPLELFETKAELLREYRALLPDLTPDQMRRIRGEQAIIVEHEPERAIDTLPELLADPADRRRYFDLFGRLLADPRFGARAPEARQRAAFERLQGALAPAPARRAAKAATKKTARRGVTARRGA